MIVFILLFITAVLTALHFYHRHKRHGRYANMVPGPTPYPFIGNMLDFDISSPENLWSVMRDVTKKYYPFTRVWMTAQALFSVRHPDDFEILSTSPIAISKGWVYDYLHEWMRTGLLTSTGEKWRQRRKILTPAFHFNILSKYNEITKEQGEQIISELKSEGKESIQKLAPFCSRITLNIICESAMGVSLEKLETKAMERYKQAIYKLGSIAVYRMPRPYIHDWMLKLMPFLKICRDQKQSLHDLHDFTDKIYKERKSYHELTGNKFLKVWTDTNEELDDVVYMGRKKRLAMLDLLLSAEKDGLIDEAGIKEEIDTFTFEGHDTTAAAMTFILMLLAENEEAQTKARAEVTKVFQKSGELGIKEVQELQYLDRCVKEALRLYPPVPTVFRYVTEDLHLKHGIVPAGSHVVFHFYDLHRDPNFWPDPDKFDPERFLPENSVDRHPFAYAPFSAGPRNCIGQKFAMNELKSLVGRILYDFHLEPVERLKNIKLTADLVLRPSKPVSLKFIPVNKAKEL